MTTVATRIGRIGDGAGLLLTAEMLRASGLETDGEVLLQAEEGRIVITRLDPELDEMVAAADRFVAAHPEAIRKLAL